MSFHAGPETIALLITVPMLAFFVVKWFCQEDGEVAKRRMAAGKLAAKLTEYGLVRMPQFLQYYSTGDLVGMYDEIHSLADLFLSSDEAVMKELEDTFSAVLDNKLATPEGQALIAAKLAAVTKAVAVAA